MIKFNLQIRHSKTLMTITNDKVDNYNNIVSYVNVASCFQNILLYIFNAFSILTKHLSGRVAITCDCNSKTSMNFFYFHNAMERSTLQLFFVIFKLPSSLLMCLGAIIN